jgi:uncharacterized protein involved in exopolysaccharide biosynthesis/beta-lactamase regulating signal transducer with metallopeptidase domain
MSIHLSIFNHPLGHHIGWALLHSLWQGALIGLAFVVAQFALRRQSANARYLAGCLCLSLLLTTPVLTVVLATGPSPASNAGGVAGSSPPDSSAPAFNAGGLGGWYAGPGAISFSRRGGDFLGGVTPLLAAGWFLGVSVCSVRLTRSCWRVRGIRLKDNEPVTAGWLETLNDLQCRLGVSRPVRLLKSALVEVPTVLGWFRPVILLPAATLSGLTPSQLEAVLAHELAHVRRLDYLVNAFQCLVETLMFYHPVAWWISRCIREERENACDDLVIEVCGDRLGYARALATLEGFRAGLPELAFAASGGSLLSRIRRLLGVPDESGSVSVRDVSGMALLGIGLVLIVLGVRLLLAPTSYLSTARIRIERDQTDLPGLAGQRAPGSYDPYFIQTEFELLQSEVILGKVVESLDLNRQWGIKYAGGERLKTTESINLLKGRMDLRPVRNTSLIEIRVYGEKAEETAKIANAIAEAYRAYRYEQRAQLQRGGIRALEERFAEQEAKVRKAQQRVDDLRNQLGIANAVPASAESPARGINDVPANADSPTPLITADTLRKVEGLRLESRAEYLRQASLLERLKKLEKELGPNGLAQAISTAVPDPVLTALQEHLDTAESQLVALTKEYGLEHIECVKTRAVIEGLQKKIRERVQGIMLGLETRVQSLSNSLDNLKQEVERATQRDMERADQSRPYLEAKGALEELKRFRQILDMKIANEKVEVELPKTTLVDIVDRAVPSLRPISPNLARATALIALGVLLDLAGFLMLTGRPGTRSEPRAA